VVGAVVEGGIDRSASRVSCAHAITVDDALMFPGGTGVDGRVELLDGLLLECDPSLSFTFDFNFFILGLRNDIVESAMFSVL
jgi:hypothetical protein